jgi:hypothetical protein
MPYDPSTDPMMDPAMLPQGEPDDDGRDEDFTGEAYPSALAPADDDDVIPFP